MLLAPAAPTIASLVLGQLPGPKEEAALLANAAGAAYGAKVKVSLALWTGLNVPLLLSIIAISMGIVIFIYRRRIIAWMQGASFLLTLNFLFDGLIRGLDILAAGVTRLQHGKLRYYLVTMLASVLVLVLLFGGVPLPLDLSAITAPTFSFAGELVILRILALLVIAGTSLACVLLTNDFFAVLAFGVSGLGVALLMALEPAPDVALVQIVVDILLIIILVLALSLLPARKLREAQKLVISRRRLGFWRDALVCGAFGTVVMLMSLAALLSRPRISELTPFFESNTDATGSKSIVGAVLTDFRGIDTLNEIVVFSIAGLGIYTLLWFGSRKHKDVGAIDDKRGRPEISDFKTLGVGGHKLAPLIRVLARIILPLAMVISVCDLLYGHEQPGDGFTAGVITSIGIGFWYVVFGYHETRRHLSWIRPSWFISCGILLAIFAGTTAMFISGSFLSAVDFGKMMNIKLPADIHLSSSFVFETAIAISVVGSVMHMLNAMGHPEEEDTLWKL
jgi:multicomponent K+:H+ antiporter subunit A